MTDEFTPAEAFPPHEHLQEELKARGWSVDDFAREAMLTVSVAEGIVSGEEPWEWFTYIVVARASDTSAGTWKNLSETYDRWEAAQKEKELNDATLHATAREVARR